jgi:hypothetical protein
MESCHRNQSECNPTILFFVLHLHHANLSSGVPGKPDICFKEINKNIESFSHAVKNQSVIAHQYLPLSNQQFEPCTISVELATPVRSTSGARG